MVVPSGFRERPVARDARDPGGMAQAFDLGKDGDTVAGGLCDEGAHGFGRERARRGDFRVAGKPEDAALVVNQVKVEEIVAPFREAREHLMVIGGILDDPPGVQHHPGPFRKRVFHDFSSDSGRRKTDDAATSPRPRI